jgi:hypothetical protein
VSRIEFRIGIHLGDVVEESDGDLMGDGVNIAARLEGVAERGGICLSEDAYRLVRSRLDLAVTDLGEKELKNIAAPVRVYSLQVGVAAQANPMPAEQSKAAATKSLTRNSFCGRFRQSRSETSQQKRPVFRAGRELSPRPFPQETPPNHISGQALSPARLAQATLGDVLATAAEGDPPEKIAAKAVPASRRISPEPAVLYVPTGIFIALLPSGPKTQTVHSRSPPRHSAAGPFGPRWSRTDRSVG